MVLDETSILFGHQPSFIKVFINNRKGFFDKGLFLVLWDENQAADAERKCIIPHVGNADSIDGVCRENVQGSLTEKQNHHASFFHSSLILHQDMLHVEQVPYSGRWAVSGEPRIVVEQHRSPFVVSGKVGPISCAHDQNVVLGNGSFSRLVHGQKSTLFKKGTAKFPVARQPPGSLLGIVLCKLEKPTRIRFPLHQLGSFFLRVEISFLFLRGKFLDGIF
mmetsp:Transcript_12344/g.27217  ORF Transcript_12344/g.27217 Transcript_12344/m.27217 type:complete len:220 (-) Transcript_12344:278-937(-)